MSRITAFLFFLLLTAATASADWPQWGGPNRSFTASDWGLDERWPESGPFELWRRPIGDGYAGIVQDRERLFTMFRDGDRDVMVALKANTGETSRERASPARAQLDAPGPGRHSAVPPQPK
jgi:hypothetical protein